VKNLQNESQGEARAWIAFLVTALLVLLTIPLARQAQHLVEATVGSGFFLFIVLAGIGAAAWAAWRRLRIAEPGPNRRIWVLIGVALAYVGGAFYLRKNPEEAVHLLEYGALGVLAARALAYRLPGAWVYPAAALLGASVGILDEAIQWMTPSRHWDLRDLAINALAASGVQLGLVAGALGPAARDGTARGLRGFCAVAALAWLLLGASLLNTPSRIANYASRIPGLGFLLQNEGVMLEYGHLHELREVARFRSRFTLDELSTLDSTRGTEAGATLRREGSDDRYREFLATYNPITDPYLHEFRVHLFRRDRYLQTAGKHGDDLARAQRNLTVAFRENAILETGFPVLLAASGASWSATERDRVAAMEDPKRRYESPVSRGLVTGIDEPTIAWVWMGGFVLLGACGLAARER